MFASDYRRLARLSLEGNWGPSIAVALVASLLGGMVAGMGGSSNLEIDSDVLKTIQLNYPVIYNVIMGVMIASIVYGLIRLFLGCVVRIGYCTYLLKQYDRQERSIKDLFSHFDIYGSAFCLALLEAICVALWTLLFVFPGIIASYRYAMAPFILAENPELTASQAIRLSKQMMKGNKGRLFCLDFSFFGWALLSALTLGVGELFLTPYVSAARAAFYRSLCDETKFEAEEI